MDEEEFEKYSDEVVERCKGLTIEQLSALEFRVWCSMRERINDLGFFQH